LRAVIVGKWLPLHKGHLHLIRTALDMCEHVTVCAFGSQWERISAEERAAAIQSWAPRTLEEARRLEVIFTESCPADPYDEPTWDWWVHELKSKVPDADTLFSSEPYGVDYARRLAINHFLVDLERKSVPISGTECRLDPMEHWEMIAPSLRKYFVKKIAIVGAESTGKSSLAVRLASHFGTNFVEETGRSYLESKGDGRGKQLCTPSDLVAIAYKHAATEDEASALSNRILFSDTDLMVTAAFGQYYFGKCPSEVEDLANERAPSYTLHLLCSTENPWVDDGTRDCTQVHREWFNARYEAEMRWRKQAFIKLPCGYEEMFYVAVEAIERTLARRVPLGTRQ